MIGYASASGYFIFISHSVGPSDVDVGPTVYYDVGHDGGRFALMEQAKIGLTVGHNAGNNIEGYYSYSVGSAVGALASHIGKLKS